MITRSENITELVAALAQAQAEMGAAQFDGKNPHFKSKYSTLAAVRDACREPLSKHGLAVIQPPSTDDGNFVITTMLMHKSGQWIASDMKLLLDANKMQALGSAITYARRYGLAAMLGIVSDEDDDGNAASGQTPSIKAPQKAHNEAPALISGGFVVPGGAFAGKRLSDLEPDQLERMISDLQKYPDTNEKVKLTLQKALDYQAMLRAK